MERGMLEATQERDAGEKECKRGEKGEKIKTGNEGMRERKVQERWNIEKEECTKGEMQERRDAGKEGCGKEGRQERRETGKKGFMKRGIH